MAGIITVTDRWLAGYLNAVGVEDCDVPCTGHERGMATQYYRFISNTELRSGVIIQAWCACKDGKQAFDDFFAGLKDQKDKEVADQASTYYSAIVMAEKYRRAADRAHCRVLRTGKQVGVIPVNYSQDTAKKFGIPFPPPPLKKA